MFFYLWATLPEINILYLIIIIIYVSLSMIINFYGKEIAIHVGNSLWCMHLVAW